MTCNVGVGERSFRIIMGIALLAIGAFAGLSAGWMALAYVVGATLLVTGALGFCPAWKLLGVSTCPAAQSAKGR